jgi:zinc protease
MIIRKRFIHFLTATVFVFAFCSPARSDDGQSSKHIFDNGLTVLVSEMPSSPVVSVYALVKAGSATEGKFLGAGISHFLEHMLFKGTHGRNVGELASRIQSVGGTINAATSYDYTIYTITVPYESFDVALDILSDMLMNATMNPEEVERERKVIFGEMRLRRDDPDRILSELVFQNVYIRHPYRHPIIGYESLLAEVTPEDLVEYYRTFYTPNNIIFSVAGNIDDQTVLPKIQEAFQGFKRTRAITRNLPEEPTQISGRRYEEEYPTDLTRLSMSFSGVSLLHPDLYALDALAEILGSGRSSRLYVDV